MDNPNIFDELTNRLNKVKRPDSGIHNSGEFIGDNERMEKSDEQADSGQESDSAELADSSGIVKRGGILNNFKKMFKIKRKSKTGKISQHNEGVIGAQYKAVSEPEINSCSRKELTNEADFTSDDDERLDDKKGGSLNNAPSFIRSSLRKLKLRRSKERKHSGVGSSSPEDTRRTVEGDDVVRQPAMSPKKSPKKPVDAPRKIVDGPKKTFDVPKKTFDAPSSHHSTDIEPKGNYMNSVNAKGIELPFSVQNIPNKPVAVNTKKPGLSSSPQLIQSTAAKDKIRVAPRGRKKPTRTRPVTSASDVSDDRSLFPQVSIKVDLGRECQKDAELSKKPARGNQSREDELQGTFDSFITSLETVSAPTTSTPKKYSPAVEPKSNKREIKQTSRENIEQINSSYVSGDAQTPPKDVRKSIEKFQIGYVPLKDDEVDRSSNVAPFADKTKTSFEALPVLRRTKSFKSEDEQDVGGDLPNIIVPLKDESAESSKPRTPFSLELSKKFERNSASKSVEDLSRLNKDTSYRSGTSNEQNYNEPKSNNNYSGNVNFRLSEDNVSKGVGRSKKSLSLHGLNEMTFAITSLKPVESPVTRLGGSADNEPTGISPDRPRKLKDRLKTESKEDVDSKPAPLKKPRPVTVHAGDTNIRSHVSPARSFGDIRATSDPPDSEKLKQSSPFLRKDKKLLNPCKRLSLDTELMNKDITNNSDSVPAFRMVALKKTGITDDLFQKEPSGDSISCNDTVEEKNLLTSVKTTLKTIETKSVDSMNAGSSNDIIERHKGECTDFESNALAFKDKSPESPGNVETSVVEPGSPVEVSGFGNKTPEFHRISLRKVEKRHDYMEKESETVPPVDVQADSPISQRSDKANNKRDSSEHVNTRESKEVAPRQIEKERPDDKEKSKPPLKVKPFSFQSHDIKDIDKKVTDDIDKPKAVPLSQTGKMPYFRRSIDIQENPNPNAVPAWITMARERQREEEVKENVIEDVQEVITPTDDVKITAANDVTAENLVKPSALKSKPTPLPKPTSPSPKIDASCSTTPTTKKPPAVSQRPKFNAKTDTSKDTCMVCGKTAYVFERCEVNNKTLHRSCAKCHACGRTLKVGNIFIKDDQVWCAQHR